MPNIPSDYKSRLRLRYLTGEQECLDKAIFEFLKAQIPTNSEDFWLVKAFKNKMKADSKIKDRNKSIGSLILLMEHHGCSQNQAAKALAEWLGMTPRHVSNCFYQVRNLWSGSRTPLFLTPEKKINFKIERNGHEEETLFPLKLFHFFAKQILKENKESFPKKFPNALSAFERVIEEGNGNFR